jgi:AcrR family transcriptional regulator
MRIRDEKKERLVIQKAIELLVSDGFEGFSMNKLAKACNISVATLYIYYKDKDDLIKKIGTVIASLFFDSALKNLSASMTFAEGLRQQWKDRMKFAIDHPAEAACVEILRNSVHWDQIIHSTITEFKETMSHFYNNCIATKQLTLLPFDVYWSIAFGPLYALLRFHAEGKNVAGKPFVLTEEIMEQSLQIVIKALTP